MKTGLFLLTENYGTSAHATIAHDIELGIYAEELGFDSVWFAEHHFNAFSCIPNPTLMMAALAAKTRTITIASAAFLAPFYHPMRLAEEIATLDNLSLGRIEAGFAKGGFAYDMEHFEKSPDSLREEMFENVAHIDSFLACNQNMQPRPLQPKIPFYIATFGTRESIEFAALQGYGLMFSQGASITECQAAQALYKELAGVYPPTVLMRVFYPDEAGREAAYEKALPATDHFIRSMRSVQTKQTQPDFNRAHYDALLRQRTHFFDGKKFLDHAILGDTKECLDQIQHINHEIKNLHLVLKPASSDASHTKAMLKIFSQKIKPYINTGETTC